MTRLLVGAVVGVLAALLVAVPAAAVKPVLVERVVFDPTVSEVDEFLSRVCGTEVTVTIAGHFTLKEFYDQDGNFVRAASYPSLRETYSSEFGSFSTMDVGLDKVTVNADGTISVFGTGIHVKVKGEASAIGLWRLVFDPAVGELVSQEYHGNFDLIAPEILAYFCEKLNPELA